MTTIEQDVLDLVRWFVAYLFIVGALNIPRQLYETWQEAGKDEESESEV